MTQTVTPEAGAEAPLSGLDVMERLTRLSEEDDDYQPEPNAHEEGEELDETDDGTEPQAQQPKRWKIKAAGEELELDESELLKHASMGVDYTRKTQALAEERKRYNEAVSNVMSASPETLLLSQFETLRAFQDTDPAQLLAFSRTNPDEFVRLKAIAEIEFQAYQQQVGAYKQQLDYVKALRLEHEQDALLAAIPDIMNDPAKKQEFAEQMLSFGREVGFSDEELDSIHDHRWILTARRALDAEQRAAQLEAELAKYRGRAELARKPTPQTMKPGGMQPLNKPRSGVPKMASSADVSARLRRLSEG